ncbi:hypothetical protein PJWF_00006 [Achromobacter phage JWF]|uniref:hypothetical protein n=1 Tax=Achromobacter phage JWF TaxID=1589748 RepID=UPI000588E13F|nr:hypothetical protein AXJ13_gp006 [Achromobacter phage JWF]AJD82900.1 hypothetical protein PJWF_00006 [Achromobacter phage JWF]
MSYHYPPLDEKVTWALGVIATLASEHEDYFLHPDCPYEGRTLVLLQALVLPPEGGGEDGQGAVLPPVQVTAEDLANIDSGLEEDLLRVLLELKRHGATLTNVEQSEKMAYFRTITSLLEKLVLLRERAAGVKQVKEFESAVLGVMEDVLDPEQRTKVMDGLRSILSKGRNDPVDLTMGEE